MISTQTRLGTTSQELVPSIPPSVLRRNVGAFAGILVAKADALNTHQTHPRLLWKTIGKQQLLRAVARHLQWLLTSCAKHDALVRELGRYLSRLEKRAGDAEMDARLPAGRKKKPVGSLASCWKAQGVAAVLPDICLWLETILPE